MSISWELPLGAYHARDYASHSKLSDLAKRGAAYYHAVHVAKTEQRDPPTPDMVFGQRFEDAVQRPGDFVVEHVVRPDGLDLRTKDGKEWKAKADGKTIIDADEWAKIVAMNNAIKGNYTAMDMIAACKAQPTITSTWQGLPGVQARPDWLSIDGCAYTGFRPFVLDLKTTSELSRLTSGKAVIDYGYFRQMGMASNLLRDNGVIDVACYLLAVEKQRPYRCQVIEVTTPWLDRGWQWSTRMLDKLADHYARNEWPRVECEAVELPEPPPWVDAA